MKIRFTLLSPISVLVLLLTVLIVDVAHAQNFEFGKFTQQELDMKLYDKDSTADAVVLHEFGTANIDIDEYTGESYVNFIYHTRIKIFNKNGFIAANFIVERSVYDKKQDEITEIVATTYNYIDGYPKPTIMPVNQIFTEQKSRYRNLTKFTLPNLKPGSIIEISYRMRINNVFNFKRWEFQSNIPKITSTYISSLPGIYNYNISLRGVQKLTSQKTELVRDCITIAGNKCDCSKSTFVMDNIPAFKEEEYMTSPDNFKSAINFELKDVQHFSGGSTSYTKNWRDVDNELTSSKEFGGQMKKTDLFSAQLPAILQNANDPLSKAKAVYAYIKKQIKWNRYLGKYSEFQIKKALDTHSGNVGDINLALIAALSAAGLDTEALLLSTRDNGLVNSLYPVITDFDYVVAKVNIDNTSYLLDATEPLLPFGLLPLRCINGKGRALGLKKPSYWYDVVASEKEVVRNNLVASLNPDGNITGKLTIYSKGYAAFGKRQKIAEAGTVDNYVQGLGERLTNIKILSHKIDNIDSLDEYLVENYDVDMKVYDNAGKLDKFFFNPYFIDRTTKNPFNLNERTYPVDLGAGIDKRVSIILTLPANYVFADVPKNSAIGLPGNGGRYQTSSTIEENQLTFNSLFLLNKPTYESDEYLYLKALYSQVIQQQKTDLVLQKAK